MRPPIKKQTFFFALCSMTGLSASVQAASCEQSAPEATCPQSVSLNSRRFNFINNQQIILETASRQAIVLDTSLQDAQAFDQVLADIHQGADTNIPQALPLRINLAQSPLYYAVGSAETSEPATLAKTPGLYLLPYLPQQTSKLNAAYFVYTAADGTLKQRLLPPLPADWESLSSALTLLNFTAVTLDTNGIITATGSDGKTYQAVMGYDVQQGAPVNEQLRFDNAAGQVNTDGSSDFGVIYPNGDRQVMRVFADTPPNPAEAFLLTSVSDQANADAYLLATTQPATLIIDLSTNDYTGDALHFNHFAPEDKIRFTLTDGIVSPGADTQHSGTANQYFSSLYTANAQRNDVIIHQGSKSVITLLSSTVDLQNGTTDSTSLQINLTGGIKNKNLLFEFF